MMTINFSKTLDLVKACMNGNRRAQKQLYDAYKVKMYTLCLRYMSNALDAEDMLQEGWVKVFSKIHTFDESKASFYTWIHRVFVNTNLEFLRKKKIKFEEIYSNESQFESARNTAVENMSMQELVAVLQELPSGYRSVFNLHAIEGFTHKEIAEKLGISPNTSKTQLMKAKQMMQTKVRILHAI